MRSHDLAPLLARLALCFLALAAGTALARYTDIARHDLTKLTPLSASYARLRASVRYTGSPSSVARASRLLRAP